MAKWGILPEISRENVGATELELDNLSASSVSVSCAAGGAGEEERNVVGVVNVSQADDVAAGEFVLHVDNAASLMLVTGEPVRKAMFNVRPAPPGDVVLMNTHPEPISQYGDLRLQIICAESARRHVVVLRDVAFCPTSKFSLLGWSRYADALCAATGRDPALKTFRDRVVVPLERGSVVGRRVQGLYALQCAPLSPCDDDDKQTTGRADGRFGTAGKDERAAPLVHSVSVPALSERVSTRTVGGNGGLSRPGGAGAVRSVLVTPAVVKVKERRGVVDSVGLTEKKVSFGAASVVGGSKEEDWGEVVLASAIRVVKRLHRRFGHSLSLDTLQRLIRQGDIEVRNAAVQKAVMTMLCAEDVKCPPCELATARKRHPSKSKSAAKKGQWTFDFSTNLPRSRTGKSVLSVWVAPGKKGVYLGFHPKKGEAQIMDLLQAKLALWENDSGEKMRTLRSDRESSLEGHDIQRWMSQRGIARSVTTGRSGGAAEGMIHSLQDKARAILNEAGLPNRMWPYAFIHANQSLDMMPDKTGLSNYERRTGEKPQWHKIVPFGCKAYAHIDKALRSKFSNRGRPALVLHRLEDGDGYKMYDPLKNTIFSADSVTVLERSAEQLPADKADAVFPSAEADVQFVRPHAPGKAAKTFGLRPSTALEEEPQAHVPVEQSVEEKPSPAVVVEEFDQRAWDEEEIDESEDEKQPLPPRVRGRPDVFVPGAFDAQRRHDLQAAVQRALSTDYVQAKVQAEHLLTGVIPKNEAAALHPDNPEKEFWKAAMTIEVDSFEEAGVVQRVPISSLMALQRGGRRTKRTPEAAFKVRGRRINGRSVIGSKWVFDIQLLDKNDIRTGPTFRVNEKGQKVRYKARLVARGDSQRASDYGKTYAPTPQVSSIRLAAAFSLQRKWRALQLDVKTAFLQSDLPENERIWMLPPKGDEINAGFIYMLLKSIYGLRQAAYLWNEDISKVLQKEGFEFLDADNCIYTHRDKNGEIVCVIALHVDDMLLVAPDDLREKFAARLKANYTMTESPARWFLKMKIQYADDMSSLSLSQPDYASEIVRSVGMEGCNTVTTPMDSILTEGSDIPWTEEESKFMEDVDYGSAVGMLSHYSLMTRPDLAQAVGQVQRFASNPRRHHWRAVQRIVKYVAGTMNYGLLFRRSEGAEGVVGYADSDHASDLDDRKSTSGYLFTYMGAAVSWKSKKQPGRAARSTAEAELNALDQAVREALWLGKMCKGLDIGSSYNEQGHPTMLIYEDNEACWNIANGSRWSAETKHVDVKYFACRDDVRHHRVEIHRIATDENPADLFTKPLKRIKFEKFRAMMGVFPIDN